MLRPVIQRFDLILENSTGQDKVQGSPDQDGQRTGFLREWAKWAANGPEAQRAHEGVTGARVQEAQLRQSRAPRSTFGASTAAPAPNNNSLDIASWTWLCVRPLGLPVAAVEKAKAEETERETQREESAT